MLPRGDKAGLPAIEGEAKTSGADFENSEQELLSLVRVAGRYLHLTKSL